MLGIQLVCCFALAPAPVWQQFAIMCVVPGYPGVQALAGRLFFVRAPHRGSSTWLGSLTLAIWSCVGICSFGLTRSTCSSGHPRVHAGTRIAGVWLSSLDASYGRSSPDDIAGMTCYSMSHLVSYFDRPLLSRARV